jgi:hypothetical protein
MHGPVRSGATGQLLPCCFNDCGRTGTTRYEHREPIEKTRFGQWRYRIYVFCSDRHRMLWRNSHLNLGNLPTGSRGMIT